MERNNSVTGEARNLPFFFIIGRPRSGTTFLRTMMDAHPNVKIPVELPFIKDFYYIYKNKINWTKDDIIKFYNNLLKQPKFNLWNIDREKLKVSLLKHEGIISLGDLCKVVYSECISFFKKEEIKILGDKHPVYTLFIPILLKVFPEAKFICITRDYRDNILSMMNVDFEKAWVPSLAYRWRFYNKIILKAQYKNPERFYRIKYEDLVTNPEKHLTEICRFIGIPYSSNMLSFHTKEQDILNFYSKELIEYFHKSLFEPISPKRIGLWRTKMKDSDIRKSDLIVGKYAEMMGYERKYKTGKFYTYLKCLPGVIYGRLYFSYLKFTDILPYKAKISLYYCTSCLFHKNIIKFVK